MKLEVPKNFEEKFVENFGRKEYLKFLEFLSEPPRKSIRINTLKTDVSSILGRMTEKGFELERIPWYDKGFWIEGEDITKTLEYFLGYYYVQEAASMIPPIVLDPKPGEIVLDLTAAPGSKTTQIAMMMENRGIIVANDISMKRLKALRTNLQKSGVMNCVVTRMNAVYFYRTGLLFDKVLLDAPCSGSGMISTTFSVFENWSPNLVKKMSSIQKKMIESAILCTKPGGVIVYSTCSLDPEENEEVITHALERFNVEVEKVRMNGLKVVKGLKGYDPSVRKAVRILPHHNKTEGFFICKLTRS